MNTKKDVVALGNMSKKDLECLLKRLEKEGKVNCPSYNLAKDEISKR